MTMQIEKLIRILAYAIMGGLWITGYGQEGDSTGSQPDEQVFELSPFEVSTTGDVGYIAGSQISMTSMNELIRDTPANISVVTSELIEDLQATDFKEALDYESGIFMDTFENTTSVNENFTSGETSPSSNVDVGDPFANAITIRGYPVPNQQRHGFRVGAILPKYGVNLGGLTDSVNTDRLEAVRGPQSLLYGINVLSGIVNIVPRSPYAREATLLTVGIGSDDYKRYTFDHTGPVLKNGRLNYRLMGAYTEKGDWTQHLLDKTTYAALQMEWRPFEKATLLVEWQSGKYRREGGGPQFFMDIGDSGIPDVYDNAYDERFSYGLDYDNEVYIKIEPAVDPEADKETDNGILIEGPVLGRPVLVENPGKSYDFSLLGEGARVSGPDPWFERDESNFLALYRHELVKDLHLELGGYYTKSEAEQFGVRLHTFVDSSAHLGPGRLVADVQLQPENAARIDPEIDPDDPYGYGVGELMVYVDNNGNFNDEIHYAGYWWYKVPTEAETLQLRARLTYAFETDLLDNRLRIRHNILLGGNYTEDTVSFVRQDNIGDSRYANWLGLKDDNGVYSDSRTSEDPFTFRPSIFDTSTIRYNGEAVVTPGRFQWSNEYPENLDQLTLSGHQEAIQWFRGAYAIYHGKFWEDKLTVVAGLRHDAYQVREREEIFIADPKLETDLWIYHGSRKPTPYSLGFGNKSYTQDRWHPEFSDDFNREVEQQMETFREAYPSGTTEYNFPKTLTYDTSLASFSYRLTDSISMFFLYSEGIFPNTGQRDGLDKPIPAEQTENNEIGLKVELLDSRIVGTFSAYRIKRHNATWHWRYAPNPSKWYPAANSNVVEKYNAFSAEAIIDPDVNSSGKPTQYSRRYAVQGWFVEKALQDAGMGDLYSYDMSYPSRALINAGLGIVPGGSAFITESSHDPREGFEEYQFVVIDYDQMMAAHESMPGGNPLVAAMDMAQVNSLDIPGDTMWWHNSGPEGNAKIHAAGSLNATGATVPFEEEGVGFDMDFVISPFRDGRYQIKLTFSEQNREVVGKGFYLADGYAIDESGERILDNDGNPYLLTTEYDHWVSLLGRESFEDPRNPSTLKAGSSISGLNLSFVPEHSWRILNKYTFQDGLLENLSVSLGVRYNSAIPTTIPIGGSNLSANHFQTPDLPERYVWDASLSYRWGWKDTLWRLSIRVDNLLDDWKSQSVIVYDDPSYTEPIVRRSLRYYDTRMFRLTLTTQF